MGETPKAEESLTRVEAGGLTFRLSTWGPPDAPAVLMLGHVPDMLFSLEPLAAALSQSTTPRRVLLPERIDLGPDRHFRAIANDIAKLIEALDCGRVDIAGIGFGGTVAIYLAIAEPQLVRALALVDAPLPNIHSIDADLSRRLAEAYAYVADFLDPGFEAKVASGNDGLLSQFWERASWWPEQEEGYRTEFAKPEYIARVAAAYRSNFTLVETRETFTAEDEQRLSPFGHRVDAVRAGEPRKLVSPAFTPEPIVLDVPSLHYFSCPQLLPPELSQYEFLSRFVTAPRIELGNEGSLGAHISDPEGIAAVITQFFADAAERAPLAVEGEPEPVREARDSRYIVEQYDKK
ncbi:MAG TPA: alpha/beta fold hydrolase, partial [Pyrinomonadaceae bacterium]|nr:alpha/beta fold hydrolase [Pyrinomonadaceae bacterium]